MREQRVEVPVDELRGSRFLDALEIVWRIKFAAVLEVAGHAFARVVPLYHRGVYKVHTQEHLRTPSTLAMLLRKRDVVVYQRNKPFAVILTVEEYERLIGRPIPTLEEEEN